MKQLLLLLFSTTVSLAQDLTIDPLPDQSSPPDAELGIIARPNSPSLEDEAVFTWHGLTQGNQESIKQLLGQNLTSAEVKQAVTIINRLATEGNIYAQELLVNCWIDGNLGLWTNQGNQAQRLRLLWLFAESNPLVHRYLVESYMEGYFGISIKKKSQLRRVQRFALNHLMSPGVGDLVIQAMKDNLLAFKSKLVYFKRVKGKNGRWYTVEGDKKELNAIEFLAKNHNGKAQAFLIECYMDNRYGADSSDTRKFKRALEQMEALDSGNPDLGALILSVWRQNLLHYGKKGHIEREQELRRLTEKYGDLLDDNRVNQQFRICNQFELLRDYLEE
ncbi:MAG: hypothetical protein KF798_06550 [Candidatus Paracaedibacteraceae bacterium]|nr:hypothetical protein [Candidatus Paracaedibacteraceae bacterium]